MLLQSAKLSKADSAERSSEVTLYFNTKGLPAVRMIPPLVNILLQREYN
jgi:hypothetical protein